VFQIERDEFAEAVKDALENLYDPIALQNSRLARELRFPDTPGSTASQQLRKMLLESMETLRPQDNIPFHRPEWMGYRVIQLRYVEGMRQTEICRELGLGHTSFYSHLRAALEAVVSVLWSRCAVNIQADISPPKPDESRPTGWMAREEAVRAARAAPRVPIDATQVWLETLNFIAPLANQRGVLLEKSDLPALPVVSADRATLRQILINILAEVFTRMAPGRLQIRVETNLDGIYWLVPAPPDLTPLTSTALAVCQGMLEVYGGRLEYNQPAGVLSAFLPAGRPADILIVDDNEDASALIQRYLQGGYQLRSARSWPEAEKLIAESKPDLILLDVILPQQDGWNILQRLKTLPETADIPVVICSVLTHPDLAFLMGADGVLQKPVEPEKLLPMLERLLLHSGSAAEPGRSAG
jgi:CheY-like chemotaxis protein